MSTGFGHYDQLLQRLGSSDLTYLVAAGVPQVRIAELLHGHEPGDVDPDRPIGHEDGWSITKIAGGTLAIERTGYRDPSTDTLRRLSEQGGAVAVVRDNVQGHLRFACARDGEVIFDDDEFLYIDDPDRIPDELRGRFELVWDNRAEDPTDSAASGLSPFAVAMNMAAVFTGLEVSLEDAARVTDAGGATAGAFDGRPASPEDLREQAWSPRTRKGIWRLVAPSYPTAAVPHPAVSAQADGVFLVQPGRTDWDIEVSRKPVYLGTKWADLVTWECGPGEVRLVDSSGNGASRLPEPMVEADRLRITVAARHDDETERAMLADGSHTGYELRVHIQVLGLTGPPQW